MGFGLSGMLPLNTCVLSNTDRMLALSWQINFFHHGHSYLSLFYMAVIVWFRLSCIFHIYYCYYYHLLFIFLVLRFFFLLFWCFMVASSMGLCMPFW